MAAGLPCNTHILAPAAVTLLSFVVIMLLRSGMLTTPKDVTAEAKASINTGLAESSTPIHQNRSLTSILRTTTTFSFTPLSKTLRFEDTPTAVAQPVHVQITTTNYTAGGSSSSAEASLRQHIDQSRSRNRIDKSSRSSLGKRKRRNSSPPSTIRAVQGHDLRPGTSSSRHSPNLDTSSSSWPGTVRAVHGHDLRAATSSPC